MYALNMRLEHNSSKSPLFNPFFFVSLIMLCTKICSFKSIELRDGVLNSSYGVQVSSAWRGIGKVPTMLKQGGKLPDQFEAQVCPWSKSPALL